MKKSNTTDLVQVNNVVLTPEAIKSLEALQNNNNYGIAAISEDISDAVCLLGQCINIIDKASKQEVCNAIEALSLMKNTINKLEKP